LNACGKFNSPARALEHERAHGGAVAGALLRITKEAMN